MNKLEKRIERLAFELFTAQGFPATEIPFKIKELQLCYLNGYNTRAQILGLVKTAKAAN
jgi:hypothetical protein